MTTKYTIVLVGTTGSGKSTAGNLLVSTDAAHELAPDDDDVLDEKERRMLETFRVGHGAGSHTQRVQSATVVDNSDIEVVDTPGFDESAEADVYHTVNLLRTLRRLENISAIVICHSGRSGSNFYQLLMYIRDLFTKEVLESNLMIMYTKTPTSKGFMYRYPQAQRNEDMQNVQTMIKDILGTHYVAPIFPIDSCPPKKSSEQWERTVKQRVNILSSAMTMSPVCVSNLQFPKHPDQRQRDELECAELESMLYKLQDKLARISIIHKKDAELVAGLHREVNSLDMKIESCNKQISNFDTSKLVITGQSTGYQSFSSTPLEIRVFSTYPIAEGRRGYKVYKIDSLDTYKINILSPTEISVVMRPFSSIVGRTGGTVVCFSEKRVFHAPTIKVLKLQLTDFQVYRDHLTRKIESFTKRVTEMESVYEIRELRTNIAELTNKKSYLSRNYLNIDEILDNISKTSSQRVEEQ